MQRQLATAGLAVGLFMGGAVAASAALLDFTDDGTNIFTGAIAGTTYTITATDKDGNAVLHQNTQNFDGNPAAAAADLAKEQDGIGIIDDEITNNTTPPFVPEILKVTFGNKVTLTGVDFLDLFLKSDGTEEEIAELRIDGAVVPLQFSAVQTPAGNNPGYAGYLVSLKGTVFEFSSNVTNDGLGRPDFALAALRVAPIPLPAGVVLLGTALAGFGIARRRKA